MVSRHTSLCDPLGCFAAGIRGSGKRAHDTREVPAFDGIEVASGIKVTVEPGPQGAPLELDGDDNLLALVDTKVEDGRLKIRFRRSSNIWSSGDIQVRVRTKALRFLGASGGAEIRAALEPARDLELSASGGAELHVRGIDVEELSAEGSGGAELELSGRTNKIRLNMSGGTRVTADKLSARSARVDGSGGSHAELRASDLLKGELSGGSDVHLIGQASSRVATSGGSSVDFDE